jgi:uncharacterized membrane protein YvbJ
MRCASCGRENQADARFCERCGSPIAPEEAPAESRGGTLGATEVCPACGAERRPGLRFCEQCGMLLPEESRSKPVERGSGVKAATRVPIRRSAPAPPRADRAPGRVAAGGRVCAVCGYLNPESARHCADCGSPLLAARRNVPARPSGVSRILGVVKRIGISAVIAVLTAVITRYLVSYVMSLGLIP